MYYDLTNKPQQAVVKICYHNNYKSKMQEMDNDGSVVPVSPMPLTFLSPDEALQHLRSYKSDWEAFVDEMEETRLRIDLGCMENIGSAKPYCNDDVPAHLIDKTYVKVIISVE